MEATHTTIATSELTLFLLPRSRIAPCRRYTPSLRRQIRMPSPSPGANTPSSSGNGAPKLLNDYVWLRAPFPCDFAHRGCLSNSVIVLGKARLARFTVRPLSFSILPAVSSLMPRRPQLGHGGDCSRKGDHIGQYTEGRDISNHGRRSNLHHRSDRSVPRPPSVRDRPAQESECVCTCQVNSTC